jgi:hypothetical protein
MTGSFSALALGAALLLAPSTLQAAITVPKSIEFGSTATVRSEVRNQCELQTLIPAAIANHSSDVQLVDGKANLSLEISEVHAPGGWIFSGPKWVEVKGSLGGNSFRAKRYSAFDPFAGGTCGILAKISRALGADIAGWLQNPAPNAELGDAR